MHPPLYSVLSLSAGLLLLYAFLRHRRNRDRIQNQDLFDTHPPADPSTGLTPLELAERQLADWQRLLVELQIQQAGPEQVRYCQEQIERFQQHVDQLRRQK